MTSRQSSVLITGGAGFIGSALARQWLACEDEQVINLDALTYAGLPESLEGLHDHPRHVLIEGDVADPALVDEVLASHRPRIVLHLAAETHVDRSIDQPRKIGNSDARRPLRRRTLATPGFSR